MLNDKGIFPDNEQHPDEMEFLLYLDHELPPDRIATIRKHIETCWSCRSHLSSLENTIEAFVEYRTAVFSADTAQPPRKWRRFLPQLQVLFEQNSSKHSGGHPLLGPLQRYLSFPIRTFLSIGHHPAVMGMALVFMVVTGSFAFLSWKDASASAVNEILKKAGTAERRQLLQAKQPVVYQKLRIQIGSQSFTRTLYNDAGSSRHLDNLKNAANSDSRNTEAIAPVERAFSQANLDWQAPLSVSRYGDWRSALRVRADEIHRGPQITEIRTTTSRGPITAATLTIRNSDLHPISGEIRLEDSTTVKIAELDYRVVELSELGPNFFGMSAGTPPAIFLPKLPSGTDATEKLIDLQVEALERLDQVGALLQDQIRVSCNDKGQLLIWGVVDSDERSSEIIHALGTLATNRMVQVDIASAEDVDARQQTPKKPIQVDTVDVRIGPLRGNPHIRKYLANLQDAAPSRLEEDIQRFSGSAVDHSIQVQLHALALKQIVNSFSPGQFAQASPKATQQWRGLVMRHAHAAQKEIVALRQQLTRAFGFSSPSREESLAPSSVDLKDSVEQLCGLTSSNDRDLWVALTATTGDAVDLSKNTKFWNSLNKQEQLVNTIAESVKH